MDKRKFLAKPVNDFKNQKISLYDHINHLIGYFIEHYYKNRKHIFDKYYDKYNINLLVDLLKVIEHHDDGKTFHKWQDACVKDYDRNLNGLPPQHLLTTGVRHEFYSYLMNRNELTTLQALAILCHHGKLYLDRTERYEQKLMDHSLDGYSIEDFMVQLRKSLKKNITKENFHDYYYKYVALRAILQIVDKSASYMEAVGPDNYVIPKPFEFKSKFQTLTPIQNILANLDINEYDIFLLKSPTGSGKSDGSLILCDRLVKAGYGDRVIFAMPTMFTSNVLYEKYSKDKNLLTTLHHSNAKNIVKASNAFHYHHNKIFEGSLTFCTIDHLITCMLHLNENAFLASFNVLNSVIVIDEIDFYDDFLLANLNKFLAFISKFKIKVIVMSATFPVSMENFFHFPDTKTSPIIADTSKDEIVKCNLESITSYDVENFEGNLNFIVDKIKRSPKTIIYSNTIKTSKRFYNFLLNNGFKPSEIILYNSHYLPSDKKKIEERLLDNFGKTPKKNVAKVAILTQIGELSVDISAPYMISDLCPIDRLIQRLGRLNRFSNDCGSLDVLIPYKISKENTPMVYHYPYGMNDNNFVENKAFRKTRELLKVGKYTYRQLNELTNLVYNEIKSIEEKQAIENAANYEMILQQNAILATREIEDEDHENLLSWSCRNIENQQQIIIDDLSELKILEHYDYSEIVTNKSLTISHHLVEQNPLLFKTVEVAYYKSSDIVEKRILTQLINPKKNYDSIMGLTNQLYGI